MKAFSYIIIVFLVFNIGCEIKTTSYQGANTDDDSSIVDQNQEISIEFLVDLFENIENEEYITSKLKNYDFKRKFNGVYISKEVLAPNEPKDWVHVNNLGSLSTIAFSTADKEIWEVLTKDLEKIASPTSFNDGTDDKTFKYVGEKFTFESYEPRGGINLAKNHLYQIYVSKTK